MKRAFSAWCIIEGYIIGYLMVIFISVGSTSNGGENVGAYLVVVIRTGQKKGKMTVPNRRSCYDRRVATALGYIVFFVVVVKV